MHECAVHYLLIKMGVGIGTKIDSTFQLFCLLKVGVLLAASENQRNETHFSQFSKVVKIVIKSQYDQKKMTV